MTMVSKVWIDGLDPVRIKSRIAIRGQPHHELTARGILFQPIAGYLQCTSGSIEIDRLR